MLSCHRDDAVVSVTERADENILFDPSPTIH